METRFDEMLANAKRHREADMLVATTYGMMNGQFRGCSIGCHLHDIYPDKLGNEIAKMSGLHSRVAEHYGYPEWLARLQDTMFEGLPEPDRFEWHVQLAETLFALPGDYDWQKALHRVHIAILQITYQTAGSAQDVVQQVIDLHDKASNGEPVSDDDWYAAESDAWYAAESDAESDAESTWGALYAAKGAGWSASESAAEITWSAKSAAGCATYQDIRDAILKALVS